MQILSYTGKRYIKARSELNDSFLAFFLHDLMCLICLCNVYLLFGSNKYIPEIKCVFRKKQIRR